MTMACHTVVLMCLFLVVFSDDTNAEVEFHRIKVVDQGVEVVEDIQYDKNNKVAVATVMGDRDRYICQSSNFHDLERQLLAIKDVETGRCYLAHSEETASQIESVFLNGTSYNPKILSYKVRKTSVPAEQLEAQAGKKIANFCKDYNTKWLVKEPSTRRRTRVERSTRPQSSCQKLCVICAFRLID